MKTLKRGGWMLKCPVSHRALLRCAVMGITLSTIVVSVPQRSVAQAPGVPIYVEGPQSEAGLLEAAARLKQQGQLLDAHQALEQGASRPRCRLALPAPQTQVLTERERWRLARQAHWRVGHYYQCQRCDQWHLSLAGGYAISSSGAVATCAHVLEKPARMKEGYLIAATDGGEVYPVREVLAFSKATDTAVIRIECPQPLVALPLSRDTAPGDTVWCFSDPSGKQGYYSEGLVSRFVRRPFLRRREQAALDPGTQIPSPVWLETTADWAPGSSGSALLDACGNAVGHVSEIQAILEAPKPPRQRRGVEPAPGQAEEKKEAIAASSPAMARSQATHMVVHQAIASAEVLALIEPEGP